METHKKTSDPFEIFKALDPYQDEEFDEPDEELLAWIMSQPRPRSGVRADCR